MLCVVSTTLMPAGAAPDAGSGRLVIAWCPGAVCAEADAAEEPVVAWMMYDHMARRAPVRN